MSDKSLLSLREIAGELNLNYRTMIDIKNQFENFLPNCFDGKNNRYTTDCIDFFRLIFALKEEGYTSEMVRKMLLKKLPLPDDAEIKEWISGYLEKYYSTWMDADGCGWMEMDADGCKRMEMDGDEPGRMRTDEDGGGRMEMEGDGHGWMKMDDLKQEILSTLPEMITEQIQPVSDQTEATLSDLTAQINAAMERIRDRQNLHFFLTAHNQASYLLS